MVEARDLTEYKVSLIEENIERHGLENMNAVQMDATVFDEASEEKADVLICDLPCSGLGVMGKKTDIRYKMTAEKQKDIVELQRQILDTVHTYVKKGGTLLYSTCTLTYGENEGLVAEFLKDNHEFYLEPLALPAVFPKNENGMLALVPGQYDTDGFFIAKLRRKV